MSKEITEATIMNLAKTLRICWQMVEDARADLAEARAEFLALKATIKAREDWI